MCPRKKVQGGGGDAPEKTKCASEGLTPISNGRMADKREVFALPRAKKNLKCSKREPVQEETGGKLSRGAAEGLSCSGGSVLARSLTSPKGHWGARASMQDTIYDGKIFLTGMIGQRNRYRKKREKKIRVTMRGGGSAG